MWGRGPSPAGPAFMGDTREKLKSLPKVDGVLNREEVKGLCRTYPRWVVVESLRRIIDERRKSLLEGRDVPVSEESVVEELVSRIPVLSLPSLRRVINATGVVLHTNLGRAPLADEAVEALSQVALNYSNLEYDLEAGKRGLRYAHVSWVLSKITGCEASLVVNNNAAAVFLVLNTLACGREVVVSRGELIEIGGSFRIPDVMRASGAVLREVGTTNKTKLSDYEGAINEKTALILKVHPSNYRIVGFTESVPLRDLVALGRRYNIPVYQDLGSGLFVDVRRFGLPHEPTVQESLKAGVDLVSFSGDKLLGGTQAGIILGRKELVERLRKNPINRVLRIDKLTLSALEATLRIYMEAEAAVEKLPVLSMLSQGLDEIRKRAERVCSMLSERLKDLSVSVVEDTSTVGGGALPGAELPTCCVCLDGMDPREVEARLRTRPKVPVVGRVKGERFLMDMRTVRDREVSLLVESVVEALS